MSGRAHVLLAVAIVLTGGCGRSGVGDENVTVAAAARPENLVVVTLDTTRADALGAYGQTAGATPHLDRLAARGTVMKQAIAPLALTRPVHATLFTGRLPHRHGVWSNGPYRLEPSAETLAEDLGAAGFSTAAVVGSFVLSRSFGLAQGFDTFDDDTRPAAGGEREKSAAAVAARALDLLEGEVRPPFFLWLHFYDPHTPYAPPEPFASRFADNPYLGEIAFVDDAVGRVLDALDARGWLDRTLVVVVADHGEGLGEHAERTHGFFLYDSTLRVPLIFAGPGAPASGLLDVPVTLADLAPTLLAAFDLDGDAGRFDGRSFWHGLKSGAIEPRPALIENRALQHQYGWATLAGLRTKDWKWIRAPEPELYDLAADPEETVNLYAARRDVARELERRRRSLLPPEPATPPVSPLDPEAEARLRGLGYLATPPPKAPPTLDGADPKRVAAAIGPIEALATAHGERDPAAVERMADAVLAIDPANLFALRVKARLEVDAGRFAAAAARLEGIVTGHEIHPEALATLARAYRGLGRTDEAIAWLQRATTPPWIYWPGLEELARWSVDDPERLPRAATLEKLAIFEPSSPVESMAVGRAYSILGDSERAAGAFARAVAADPGHVEARVRLAQAQARQGHEGEALATVSAIASPTVESVFVRASILLRLDRGDEACEGFRATLAMGAENANLLLALSRYLRRCGDEERAEEALDRLLARFPGHPQARAERAGRR